MMGPLASIDTDILVVGHGISGLSAACFLASTGKDVTVVGSGTPSTALSTSCFAPGDPIDMDSKKALAFLKPILEMAGFPLVGGIDNWLEAITHFGTKLPCCVMPKFSAAKTKGLVAILGFVGHPDVDSDMVSVNLRSSGMMSRALWTRLLAADQMPSAVQFGEKLVESAAQDLGEVLEDIHEETVFIPPLFPLNNYAKSMNCLQSYRNVRELVTPLSLPGLRFQEAIESASTSEGVKLLKGRELSSVELDGKEASSAKLVSGIREQRIEFSDLVLASGDITLSSARSSYLSPFQVSEPVEPNRLQRTLRSGIEVEGLRAVSRESGALKNVFVCGAAIPQNSFVLGTGITGAIRSSWKVSRLISGGT